MSPPWIQETVMTFRPAILAILLATVQLSVGARPSCADWLVTDDGHRVETRGSWQIKGEVVLFELPSGGLVSMRLDEVDLEASRQLTAGVSPAAEADSPLETTPGGSVFRLTDADVRHVNDEAGTVAAPADTEGDGSESSRSATGRGLVVTEWSEESDPAVEGLVIVGTLRNSSPDTSGNIRLVTRLYDVDGAFIASGGARLTKVVLPPGESAHFRAEIPGVFTFSAVRFETASLDLEPKMPTAEEQESAENEGS